jgi:hypothetical protein
MKKEQVFDRAIALGWKKWGGFKKKHGSTYQCFRRKNDYLWIGYRYVQRTGFADAVDFVIDGRLVRGIIK